MSEVVTFLGVGVRERGVAGALLPMALCVVFATVPSGWGGLALLWFGGAAGRVGFVSFGVVPPRGPSECRGWVAAAG